MCPLILIYIVYSGDDSSNSTRRDFEELTLRAVPVSDDESGAIDLDTLIHYGKVLIPPVWNGVKQLIDEQYVP